MDAQLTCRIQFLQNAGIGGMKHSERGLLQHLLGTHELLVDWGARAALCDAGLFHSVYGTEHYQAQTIPLAMRKELQQLIGTEAEMLAWLFGVMRRETFDENVDRAERFRVTHRLTGESLPLTPEQFFDLVNLTFANTLEAMPRLSWKLRRACRASLRPFRRRAMPEAERAFRRIEASWWELWR